MTVVAALALGVVMSALASSASAAPVWEECAEGAPKLEFKDQLCKEAGNGPFGWKEVTAAKLVDSEGELLLEDEKTLLGKSAVKCKGVDHGTIGPGSHDLISNIEATSCTAEETCKAPITAKAINLPWLTVLETVGTEVRDDITSEIAGKDIGWEVTCNTIGGTQTDICESALTTTGMDNNTESNDVVGLFDSKSSVAKCSKSTGTNKETGHVKGFDLIFGLLTSGTKQGIRVS